MNSRFASAAASVPGSVQVAIHKITSPATQQIGTEAPPRW
jgi:hypothetical protein